MEYPKSRKLFYELAETPRLSRVDGSGRSISRLGVRGADGEAAHTVAFVISERSGHRFGRTGADRPRRRSGCGNAWTSEKPTACRSEKSFFRWEELQRISKARRSFRLRELELDRRRIYAAIHVATRPSMAFHGNMQVAVAEARTIVEAGNRVVFFASSNGEVERLADILQRIHLPFQLGLDPNESTPAYLAERAYMAGTVAGTFLVKGTCAGRGPYRSRSLSFGSEDLFDTSEMVARPGSSNRSWQRSRPTSPI